MKGTTPAGAVTEREAAEWVRGMFGRVARRYDLANHLLSFNLDRYWRARTVARVRPVLRAPGARALDLCCGTGDLLLALAAERNGAVLGSVFCQRLAAHCQDRGMLTPTSRNRCENSHRQPNSPNRCARPDLRT